jgi:hypothetical protein
MRNSTRGKPPGLEHQEALARHPRLLEQCKRHNRALACSRRRLKYDGMVRSERARQLRKCLIDR